MLSFSKIEAVTVTIKYGPYLPIQSLFLSLRCLIPSILGKRPAGFESSLRFPTAAL